MSINFSDHAKNQLKERRIPERQVIETIKKPDKRARSFRNRTLREKRFGDKILEVATVTEG